MAPLARPFFVVLAALLALAALARASAVVDVSDADLDATIGDGGSWLVEFYAPWCGYCRRFEPVLEQIAATLESTKHAPKTRVARVNVDQAAGASTRFMVARLPTIYHVHAREVREMPTSVGFDKDAIVEWIVGGKWRDAKQWKYWGPFSPIVGNGLWLMGQASRGVNGLVATLNQYLPKWATGIVVMLGAILLALGLAAVTPNPFAAEQPTQQQHVAAPAAKPGKKAKKPTSDDDEADASASIAASRPKRSASKQAPSTSLAAGDERAGVQTRRQRSASQMSTGSAVSTGSSAGAGKETARARRKRD